MRAFEMRRLCVSILLTNVLIRIGTATSSQSRKPGSLRNVSRPTISASKGTEEIMCYKCRLESRGAPEPELMAGAYN